ncbi:hypothetical protein [uncultured Sphingomonas sp.]|uniref:hypothetical protein n=1 Tax=uncultured Sphingomonas sp. TaxID=158754 RepID=UPI0025DDDBEF|nr:hypothetical protein [uncultured Sphingomonas sp.]
MSARSLDSLPRPPRAFDIARRRTSKFETKEATQKEDRQRIRALRNYPGRSAVEQRKCNRLARRIHQAAAEEGIVLASSQSMRDYRGRCIGELWRLSRGKRTYFVTLIPRGMSVTPDELEEHDPTADIQWLRVTLGRLGANVSARGWIYGYLEGEYNPATGKIQLHYHVIVQGLAMLDAIERLREHSRFLRLPGAANNPDGIDVRVHGKRVRQCHLPEVISYTTKGAWYSRWRGTDLEGRRTSQANRCRVPEPANTKVLLWLDRWRVSDMTMLINLRVGREGLVPRRR